MNEVPIPDHKFYKLILSVSGLHIPAFSVSHTGQVFYLWCIMRVGWKVHRLTKKKLCHSNETWHALNSTFPAINCIVSFQINPHWISNSGLRKVALETFRERPGKLMKPRTMLLHISLWLQWLLCMTVALNWLITLHILLIWHHLTIFCSPT